METIYTLVNLTTSKLTLGDTIVPPSGSVYVADVTDLMTSAEQKRLIDILGLDKDGNNGPGMPGEDGEDGEDGTDGNSVLSGTVAPTSMIGVDGDFYIDYWAHVAYGPKLDGEWPAGVSMIGPAGEDGEAGPPGPQGPQGPSGEGVGIPGADGQDGVDGVDGEDGRSVRSGITPPDSGLGVDGDFYIDYAAHMAYGPKTGGDWGIGTSMVGTDGANGADGAQGPAGNDGADGQDGAPGPAGQDGVDGINGADGAPGPAGNDGAPGVDGVDGRTILNGVIPPTNLIGVDGDFYIDYVASVIYGPKGGNTWPAGVSLVGADGAPGADGIDGTNGVDGAIGPQGPAGNDGAQGPQGPAGEDGVDGTNGAPGVDGVDGADGINGVDGRTILNGTTAPSNLLGANGDFYINTVTNLIYGPKAGGGWPTGVSLIGPEGPAGADGADGATSPLLIGNGTTQQVSVNVGSRLDLIAGTNVTLGFDDAANSVTINATGGGGGGSTTTLHPGTGGVSLLIENRLNEILTPKGYGAVGDGVTTDSTAMASLKTRVDSQFSTVVNFSGARYKTGGVFWPNNVSPTVMYFDKASVIGLFDGTSAAPNDIDNDPALFVQKYTKYDNNLDRYAHNVGGVFGSVIVKGTGVTGSTDTDGTWLGILGNAVLSGVNQGSAAAPDFDAYGNVIGVAGFARTNGWPGNGQIVCGIWGYAEGPVLDGITHGALPAGDWTIVGCELNVQINHPDIGVQDVLVGKGSSVGQLVKNYRTPNTGVRDWTFGAVYNGTPNNNDYTNHDIANWNGFYTGIMIDHIKSRGILFGKYFGTDSIGIEFPTTYATYVTRPKAAIHLGDNVMNLGQYTGATWNNNDMWHNGGTVFYRTGGVNRSFVTKNGNNIETPGGFSAGVAVIPSSSGGSACFSSSKVGESSEMILRSQNTAPSTVVLQRARDSAGSILVVQANDQLGGLFMSGYDGTATYTNSVALQAWASETYGTGLHGSYFTIATTSTGANARTERVRVNPDGSISHRVNATTIVDANSHLGLRSYTVATLPSAAAAGFMIYVSNGTVNKRLAVSDGTNWRFPDGAIVS